MAVDSRPDPLLYFSGTVSRLEGPPLTDPTTPPVERLRQAVRDAVQAARGGTTPMTIADIQRTAGVSRKHLNLVLNGTSGISLEMAERIVRACGQTLNVTTAPKEPT